MTLFKLKDFSKFQKRFRNVNLTNNEKNKISAEYLLKNVGFKFNEYLATNGISTLEETKEFKLNIISMSDYSKQKGFVTIKGITAMCSLFETMKRKLEKPSDVKKES